MTVRSSDSCRRSRRTVIGDERGTTLAFVALVVFVLLAVAGLAIDLGRGYVTKLRTSRAVDAAALAGAQALRLGQATDEATAVFHANLPGITPDIDFGTNERGEQTVTVSASQDLPTVLIRVLSLFGCGDCDTMTVAATGQAAVPPLDIVLLLDTSGSLETADAWDDLQGAAKDFIDYFDDGIDRMGLVSFQIVAHLCTQCDLGHNFKSRLKPQINAMASNGDTNIGEGFRLAREQITGSDARSNAVKVVVFFTDGRATALRGVFGGPPWEPFPAQDRIMAVFTRPGDVRGYFNDPDGLAPFQEASPSGCGREPECFGLHGGESGSDAVRTLAAEEGLVEAALIRQFENPAWVENGIYVYSIGLGNFNQWPPGDIRNPDLDYLCQVANTDEIANPSQDASECDANVNGDERRGQTYFAREGDDLNEVFEAVARDLIVRLAS